MLLKTLKLVKKFDLYSLEQKKNAFVLIRSAPPGLTRYKLLYNCKELFEGPCSVRHKYHFKYT